MPTTPPPPAPVAAGPPPPPHHRIQLGLRWGHQTSLFQWGQPAFYLFLLLFLLAAWFHAALQVVFADISPQGLALSWALLALYALPVFLVVYFLDLFEREPMSLVIGAFLWGALVATGLAGIANDGWGIVVTQVFGPDFAADWAAALIAPVTEEILKALGVVMIYLIARREVDDMMDGFVYGALVGLGFTVLEDIFYFLTVFEGTISGVLTGFFLRVVASGLYGHVLYTGLTGMGIAYFVSRRGEETFGRRFAVLVGLFVVAMGGHFVWNSPLLDFFPEYPWTGAEWAQIFLATAVKGLPFLLFLVFMVRLARRRERRWLQVALAGEVGKGGLLPEELETLMEPRRRRLARRELARRAGPRAAAALKQLQRLQIDLAMVRTRVTNENAPDLVRLREQCRTIRDSIYAMTSPPPPASPPASPPAGP